MAGKRPGKKIERENLSLIALLAVGVVFLGLLGTSIFGGGGSRGIWQKTTSDLISTKEIATLSVSEFVYNGITQALKENGEPDYNVLYKSTVKVSVDAEKLDFNIDEKNKVVTFFFPELTIETPVIDIKSISLIPNRNDLYIDDVIKLCRSDAYAEATKSDKLISSAQDNIRSIMEAWYSPVLEGYSFEYKFGAAEGGGAQ